MKLPPDCRYAVLLDWTSWDDREEMYRTNCCRAHGFLEEPLCRSWPMAKEVYRFIWESSFNGRAIVQVNRGFRGPLTAI
jgi:hypothetical protein